MRFFQKVKEIRSKEGNLHFQRYAIFETALLSLYIHRIYRADEDEHLHNHPWNFISMVLWGSYLSMTRSGIDVKNPGSLTWMTWSDFHKVYYVFRNKPVTTLFLAYGMRSPWGYMVDGWMVDHETYRDRKNTGTL